VHFFVVRLQWASWHTYISNPSSAVLFLLFVTVKCTQHSFAAISGGDDKKVNLTESVHVWKNSNELIYPPPFSLAFSLFFSVSVCDLVFPALPVSSLAFFIFCVLHVLQQACLILCAIIVCPCKNFVGIQTDDYTCFSQSFEKTPCLTLLSYSLLIQAVSFPGDFSCAVAGLIFLEYTASAQWSAELLVITYSGGLKSYLVR